MKAGVFSPFLILLLLQTSGASAIAAPKAPLYVRLGGKSGITRIADTFVDALAKDKNLLADPQLREIEKRANKPKVKARLSDEICKASGGPCRPVRTPIVEGAPPVTLGMTQWFNVIQDANHALDLCQVSGGERAELLSLLLDSRNR